MSESTEDKSPTENTYDRAALGYAAKFESIGARTVDVDRGLELFGSTNPSVVEIGCANGREAEYILSKTNQYLGMDISEEMLKLARERISTGEFTKADVNSFSFPESIDVVFAFASLLHSSKEELTRILSRIHNNLNEDGIVYISLKRKEEYCDEVVEDKYGPRHFYYYTKDDVIEAAGDGYEEVFYEEQEREESWLTLVLRKK